MDNQQPSLSFKQLKEDKDYLIYEDGRLYSKKSNKFLLGKIDNVGYLTYSLSITDKLSISGRKLQKMMYAHRLVAKYFLPNVNNLPYVHHKDENKLNNHYSNLEWVTPSENNLDYRKKHKIQKKKPEYFKEDLPYEKWIIFQENPNYEISSCGRIRNKKTNRLLRVDNNQKYSRIELSNSGKRKKYYIHRLVYCSFNNDYNLDGYVIDHIDNDAKNNNLSNLQKITQQENCLKQERFNDYFTEVETGVSKCKTPTNR